MADVTLPGTVHVVDVDEDFSHGIALLRNEVEGRSARGL